MNVINHACLRKTGRLFFGAAAAFALLAAPASKAADYARVIRAEHPVLYLRLDEPPSAAVALDQSSAHLNGTYSYNGTSQAASLVPGISTNSLNCSPVAGGATVTIPFSARLCPVNADGLTGGPWSAECWVKPTSAVLLEVQPPLAMCGPAGAGTYAGGSGWSFDQTSTGAWRLTMRTVTGPVTLSQVVPIAPKQWTYLAASFDGASAVWYINGAAAQTKPVPGYLANPGSPGTVGATPQGQGIFAGAVAEVTIYTNVLDSFSASNHFAVGIKCLQAKGITVVQAAPNP